MDVSIYVPDIKPLHSKGACLNVFFNLALLEHSLLWATFVIVYCIVHIHAFFLKKFLADYLLLFVCNSENSAVV